MVSRRDSSDASWRSISRAATRSSCVALAQKSNRVFKSPPATAHFRSLPTYIVALSIVSSFIVSKWVIVSVMDSSPAPLINYHMPFSSKLVGGQRIHDPSLHSYMNSCSFANRRSKRAARYACCSMSAACCTRFVKRRVHLETHPRRDSFCGITVTRELIIFPILICR